MLLPQAPAQPHPDPVAGPDALQAGVHGLDQLAGLVDPAAQLLGDPAEDEASEHLPLAVGQRRPAAVHPFRQRPGRPGQGALVARPGHLDQQHVVVEPATARRAGRTPPGQSHWNALSTLLTDGTWRTAATVASTAFAAAVTWSELIRLDDAAQPFGGGRRGQAGERDRRLNRWPIRGHPAQLLVGVSAACRLASRAAPSCGPSWLTAVSRLTQVAVGPFLGFLGLGQLGLGLCDGQVDGVVLGCQRAGFGVPPRPGSSATCSARSRSASAVRHPLQLLAGAGGRGRPAGPAPGPAALPLSRARPAASATPSSSSGARWQSLMGARGLVGSSVRWPR